MSRSEQRRIEYQKARKDPKGNAKSTKVHKSRKVYQRSKEDTQEYLDAFNKSRNNE